MGMSKPKLFREIIKAALDFHHCKPWQGCPNGHAFALRLPEQEHPWFGSVLGGGGEEFGLSLTRGPHAAEQMAAMLSYEPDEFERGNMDFLGFTIDPLHQVPPAMRKPLEKAKFPARRETLVPFFVVKEPGVPIRSVNKSETELVLHIVKGVLHTLEAGTFKPGRFGAEFDILTLSITGDLLEPDVMVTREAFNIPLGGNEFAEPADPAAMPDGDDLTAWKAVDTRVTGRIARAAGELIGDKSMARYFGSVDDAEHLLIEYGEEGAEGCYVDWLGCLYRSQRGAKTVAEQLLTSGLPKADQVLLEARAASTPTFCRFRGVEKGSVVLLENIFSGETIAAHDHMLAEGLRRTETQDLILAVRYYRAGDFYFLAMIGPHFSGMQLPDVLDFLEAEGLRPAGSGFVKKTHLIGRIWDWRDERIHAPMPTLCKTDDEPIEWHTASYALDDEAAFQMALSRRDDMELEGPDDESGYVWFREEVNPRPGMGNRTLLGRIQLVGGEAVTEVNSAGRHTRMKAWLEAIPGVRFLDVRKKDMRAMLDDQPLDDEMNPPEPLAMTPELADAMNQHLHDYYMDWLDQPIPMLDDKTPRQVCKTASGKGKVAALIRGMGSPMMDDADGGVDVPREEMLRELGLA